MPKQEKPTIYNRCKTATVLSCLLPVLLLPMYLQAAGLPEADPDTLGFSAERLARIDTFVQAEVDAGRIAGAVVTIARHGKLAHAKAYGLANLESGAPMRNDNLFRLYSMTKPIASVALLTLYEQGKFQLTDPLDRYLPELADLKVYAGKDANGNLVLEDLVRKPTIQDAFRHTLGLASGLGRSDVDALYRDAGLSMFALDSLEQEITKFGQVPLLYQPGERWVYGLGHDVQARFTDHPFATLSLSGSAPDYVRFGQMLLNGGELDGVRILGRKTVELMAQNHLPPNIPSITPGSTATGYGLGVSVTLDTSALGRLESVGSFGWGGAATTVFRVDPAEDMVVVIMAQRMPNDTAFMERVSNLAYQALVD